MSDGNWISVEDELPTGYEYVLGYFPKGLQRVRVCEFFEDDGWQYECSGMQNGYEPTHWQPLPQPPKDQ